MTVNQFAQVLDNIDQINAQDPNSEVVDGEAQPKALIYGRRMSRCLADHWPDADELLQIAVRAQHIKRWTVPRSEFEQGKAGYLKWRKSLGVFHAELTQQLMLDQGYKRDQAEQTAAMIRKEKLKTSPATQTLEDVACLVFLAHYLEPFATKHSAEKNIDIIRKTWKKMSAKGHQLALAITLPEHLSALVEQALAMDWQ